VTAAERFLSASRAGEVAAAVVELAPDVRMLNPASDDPILGRDAVADALRAIEAACDEFRHTNLLADLAGSNRQLFALVFEARIGDKRMRGVDLIEVDDRDLISSFVVLARPLDALMALGARMRQGLSPGSDAR